MSSPKQRLMVILLAAFVFQIVAWGISALLDLPALLTAGVAALVALGLGLLVVRQMGQ